MLARQIADLTLLRLVRVTRRRFGRVVGIEVGAGGRAIEVRRDWKLVDVVHWIEKQRKLLLNIGNIGLACLRNSPPSFGKPERETCTISPVPLLFEVMTTAPRTRLLVESGNFAMYGAPAGSLVTTGASSARTSVFARRVRSPRPSLLWRMVRDYASIDVVSSGPGAEARSVCREDAVMRQRAGA
jgi:hypothetical protein